MKRIISLFLSLTIFALGAVLPLGAFAQDGVNEPIILENPFYAGREIYDAEPDAAELEPSYHNGELYLPAGEELYSLIKDKLVAREKSFTIHYLSSVKFKNLISANRALDRVFAGATEEELSTGTTDGDYLRWSVSIFGTDNYNLDKNENGAYYYTANMIFDYYSSPEMEQEVNKTVKKLISSINTSGASDYQILKKIHDHICASTSYAYEALDDPYSHMYAYTPYGALVGGKCVCQGYALAFYRVCKELGYKVRFVSSSSSGGNHAWNVVNLDGKCYFVDCTWDDQVLDEELDDMSPYQYFLVSYDEARAFDSRHKEHTLEDKYYDNEYFNSNFRDKFDENNYNSADSGLLSGCVVSLSADKFVFSGKRVMPGVTVRDKNGKPLVRGRDYTVEYSGNVYPGCARVNIIGRGEYAFQVSHRIFKIVPQKGGKKFRRELNLLI